MDALAQRIETSTGSTVGLEKQYELLTAKQVAFMDVRNIRTDAFEKYSAALEQVKNGEISSAAASEKATAIRKAEQAAISSAVSTHGLYADQAAKVSTTVRGLDAAQVAFARSADLGNKAQIAATGSGETLRQTYERLFGSTEKGVGVTSRLKDELLGLALTFGGVFGAIEGIRGVSDAFVILESAQIRLKATLGGNEDFGNAKLDMLRRTADRLGISYGVLVDEYSKMASAARGSVLAPDIDQMFVRLQEVYRVNKLNQDKIRNANHDIAEMISQGQIYHRVIVQQLGTVLPSAVQMYADSLHKSTGEFERLMKAGAIGSETLKGFVDTMWESSKSTLPAAMQTYTAALGQLSNKFFEAKVAIAENGVAPALKTAVDSLNALMGSAQGDQILKNIGAALGGIITLLAKIPENFTAIVAAVGGFIGLKLTQTVVEAGFAIKSFATALIGAIVPARTAGAAIGTAATAATGLRAALSAPWAGAGIAGVVFAITTAISYFRSGVDDSTEALHKHRELIDQVKNAYEQAGDKTKAFTEIVTGVSRTQVEQNFQNQNKALREANRLAG